MNRMDFKVSLNQHVSKILIPTNSHYKFKSSCLRETGLLGFHKMNIRTMKNTFQKLKPKIFHYSDYKLFSNDKFNKNLLLNLSLENYSLFVTFYPFLVTFYLLLATLCSLVVTFSSLLVSFCSLLVTFYLLPVTFRPSYVMKEYKLRENAIESILISVLVVSGKILEQEGSISPSSFYGQLPDRLSHTC